LDDALDYAMRFGRGNSKSLVEKFVKMYVNDLTINMGEKGKDSILTLLQKAKNNNIISFDEILFVDSNSQKIQKYQ
jgi:1,4-dihydroxy-6-naphthoate synthase